MKRKKISEHESYTEGNLDLSSISYFLKHLDNFKVSREVKHKLKVILIEVVSNILAHSESKYGSVSVLQKDNSFVVKTANFAATEKINRTIALLKDIKEKENLREHYLKLLSEVTFENQVSLGLIEIVRLSEGRIEISGSELDGKQVINFEIELLRN